MKKNDENCCCVAVAILVCIYKFAWQQAGDSILLDADATSVLHKRRIMATDDSFKFTLFQVVCMSFSVIT